MPHGKLTAQKWLDSVEKQKRRSDLKFAVTDRQAGRRLDSAPRPNVVAMVTISPMVVPSISGYMAYSRLIGDFVKK